MKVLALDTALAACSVALWQDGRILGRQGVAMTRGQSEALMPMVVAVMAAAGLDFAALDRIAVTVGPGAFTGIRIGLAAARGLALALDIPAVGVSTCEAVAHGLDPAARRGRVVVVALEAGPADLYVQPFTADLAELAPAAAMTEAEAVCRLPAEPLVVVGTAAARLGRALAGADPDRCLAVAAGTGLPDAAKVAAIAAARMPTVAGDGSIEAPGPLYLRPPYAKLPAAPGPR